MPSNAERLVQCAVNTFFDRLEALLRDKQVELKQTAIQDANYLTTTLALGIQDKEEQPS